MACTRSQHNPNNQNNIGSLILNHHQNHHFRLFNSFSTTSFCRKLISTVSCGGCFNFSNLEPDPIYNPGSKRVEPRSGSDKLMDLLNICDSPSTSSLKIERREDDKMKKEKKLEELREAVKMVQSELPVQRENGANRVRGLAKEDSEARFTLAMLGAIPPLVAMVDDNDDGKDSQIQALYALLNLGIGNDLNKAAIVQAGAVHKMLTKIENCNGCLDSIVSEAIVANFLALSALDSNKPIIGSSGAIPFLANILKDTDNKCSSQARQDALRALYNLSISPSNIQFIIEIDLIQLLMNMLGEMGVSERILSILSNVVSIPEGRKAISQVPNAFATLIDVLNWTDSPGCQEKGSYILMVMAHKSYKDRQIIIIIILAHKSYKDRQTMIECGIGSTLLELTLLGSTLAQKRASRILECLKYDKGKHVSQRFNGGTSAAVSAPIYGGSSSMSSGLSKEEGEEGMMMSEEKKAVKQLVQQSLQNNMRRIANRANLHQEFVPSEHLKSLTTSSNSSKSLPF